MTLKLQLHLMGHQVYLDTFLGRWGAEISWKIEVAAVEWHLHKGPSFCYLWIFLFLFRSLISSYVSYSTALSFFLTITAKWKDFLTCILKHCCQTKQRQASNRNAFFLCFQFICICSWLLSYFKSPKEFACF